MKNEKKIWNAIYKRELPLFVIWLANEGYTKGLKKDIGWSFKNTLFISERGVEQSYRAENDELNFCLFCKRKYQNNPLYHKQLYKLIKTRTRELSQADALLTEEVLSGYARDGFLKLFKDVTKKYSAFYGVLSLTTHLVRFFSSFTIGGKNKILKQLARLRNSAAKAVLHFEEKALVELFEEIAKRLETKETLCYYLLPKEIISLLENPNRIFPEKVLKERLKRYLLLTHEGKTELFIGEKSKIIEEKEIGAVSHRNIKIIKGSRAFSGRARGSVRIIERRKDCSKIKKNEIIVASMTSLWLTPYLGKVSAITTDEGGITCHAAIISRELGIPCIIGTKIATKVLKDGDVVEVDAEKGVVRVLKRKYRKKASPQSER